jgi:hypothetical protein
MAPPPLIDPDVDIANDPAYAIRLLDILDQISLGSSGAGASSSSTSGSGVKDSSMQMSEVRH